MLVCGKCGSENIKAVDREIKNGRVPGTFRTVPSYFCEDCKKYRQVKEMKEYPDCKETCINPEGKCNSGCEFHPDSQYPQDVESHLRIF